MKAVIAICAKDLIVTKFGEDKWQEILKGAGIEKEPMMMPISDIDDNTVMAIIGSIGKTLNLSMTQVADAFGDYWVNEYAPKLYSSYYQGVNNAKEFLLKMDSVHEMTTKKMKDARPPRFEYQWKNDKTLVMKYISQRGLIDIFIGLVKGVGKYYKEDLRVSKVNEVTVEIIFP